MPASSSLPTIGLITIGQSPRDDIVPDMVAQLGREVEVIQAGAIDGLSLDDVLTLSPVGDEAWAVSRMRDGREVRLAKRELDPRMQQCINELEARGVDLIVPLCASNWSSLSVNVPFINPGAALTAIVHAMLRPGGTLGMIAPTAAQAKLEEQRAKNGTIPVVATFAQPYAADPDERLRQCETAGRLLADARVDLIYMGCMGHTREMRAVVREASGRPTLTANGVIAGLIAQAVA
jgi:protein AroM